MPSRAAPSAARARRVCALLRDDDAAAQSGADAHLGRTATDERLHDRETPAEREG